MEILVRQTETAVVAFNPYWSYADVSFTSLCNSTPMKSPVFPHVTLFNSMPNGSGYWSMKLWCGILPVFVVKLFKDLPNRGSHSISTIIVEIFYCRN